MRLRSMLAATALMVLGLMSWAGSALAAEAIYWDNYGTDPDNVGFANVDGSGGGLLNLGGQPMESPEGMAYDTVTNRLFVATSSGTNGSILAINLDGSGAAPFTAPGAEIEEPEGVAVDPATRMIYWANTDNDTISWAQLDGSAGGVLNTSGTTIEGGCCRIAIDPVGGRVYWVNNDPTPNTIGYANLNNSGGGGILSTAGSAVEPQGEGLAVDPVAGRLYFAGGGGFGYANLNGSGGGNVVTGSAVINSSWGIAWDPTAGRLYWGNEGNSGAGAQVNAFGFANPSSGTGGNISIATTPVDGPQDPVILKSPTGTGAPTVSGGASLLNSALSCTQGSWAADFAGSFVYQAPRSYGYQWNLNGASVAGATAGTYTAGSAGAYTCSVTATNQSGSATQTSPAFTVGGLQLTVKPKKAHAKAGKKGTFKAQVINPGSVGVSGVQVCPKLTRKAKKGLKAGKCSAKLAVPAGQSVTVKVSLKAKKGAAGTYGLSIEIPAKSFGAKAVKVKMSVKATKKKGKGKKGHSKH